MDVLNFFKNKMSNMRGYTEGPGGSTRYKENVRRAQRWNAKSGQPGHPWDDLGKQGRLIRERAERERREREKARK